ncbi:putative fidgetin-like protein 2 isoform X2 [Heterocephalus glaber]|nr:putative fidgetin-like protein 2 isoform X2 [Heterocephalus glaber]XP_004862982.1 putative fidgetin-like protein 2 isoform X2 [Heterocephalus glaber]XP_004862983.1 putative fidgetin-like protein 2 isoform X2 [Heterocephalus glaber]
MHWTPEHVQPLNQWPEQHLDVSSTTPSPAHKLELPPGGRQRCHYAWAHDDISALTASNLLKRYAEKYSGVLDSPYERPALGSYGDATFLNGAKGDTDPWPGPEPPYPLASLHEGLPGTKSGGGGGSTGLGSSPVLAGNLPEPLYAGNACGGPAAPEYAAGYGGGYLAPGYCAQTGAGLPPPPPAALLQPAPPPGYGPSAPLYNYAAGGYAAQPGYGALPHPAAPPTSYLASGLPAPTPLPAPTSYSFQAAAAGAEAGVSLKRKAADEGAEGRYRKYVYEPAKAPAADGAPYPAADNGECRGNGFRAKPPGAAEEASSKYGGGVPLKVLGSPVYGPQLEPYEKFPERAPAPAPRGSFAVPSGEPSKGVDAGALELVTSKLVDCGPPVQWADVAGQGALKAALEEELVWPLLRPPAYPGSLRPPRTVLLFGPRGSGKALLGRCLATQLGATLLRLRGASVAAQGAAEGARLLQAAFTAARCRSPAVVLLSELDALLPARDDGAGAPGALQAQLLACLDSGCGARADGVLVVGTTSRPAALDEATRRRFALRFYVALPDSPARGQILQRALAQQGCALSERELSALVQGTQGFSGGELGQLCQQAAAGAVLPGLQRPLSYKDLEVALAKVGPRGSPKELDSLVEWDKMYGSGH